MIKNAPAVFLAALFAFSGCSQKESGVIKVQGIVDGEILTVRSLVSGRVEECFLAEGKPVKKDGILAVIDSEKHQKQIEALNVSLQEIRIQRDSLLKKKNLIESHLAHLQKQVERFRRLEEKKAVPGEKLENMELKLLEAETSRYETVKSLERLRVQKEKTELQKSRLHLMLDDFTVLSPSSGVVLEKFISAGENVFPGTPVADILDEASLFIECFVENRELSRITMNQQAEISVDGIEEILTGTVTAFGKQAEFSPKYIISEKERQFLLYLVKVKIEQKEDVFKIGMPVTVIF